MPMAGRESELEARIRELEATIDVLQAENQGLADRAEDTLLLSILAEAIYAAPSPAEVFSRGLERASILKDIPVCLACTLEAGKATVVAGFLSTCDMDPAGHDINIDDDVLSALDDGSLYLDDAANLKLDLPALDGWSVTAPATALLIPTVGQNGDAWLFVFADDREAGRLAFLSLLLHRATDMMAARAANVRLIEELVALNAELTRVGQARGDFMAAMSHELRTPLNSIIGFSSIMLQGMAGDITAEQRRQLTMISDSGRHLLSLIGNLLDLAKVESGVLEVTPSVVDLSELAQALAESVVPMAHEKGLDLTTDIEPCITVTTDRVKLSQVLLNLLSNAVKFTDQGSVELGAARDDSGGVRLWVRDSGIGIPAESLAVIFEQFHQLPPAGDSAKTVGAGLGLAISQQVAHLLGGAISVTSEVGKGSVFTLTLPISP